MIRFHQQIPRRGGIIRAREPLDNTLRLPSINTFDLVTQILSFNSGLENLKMIPDAHDLETNPAC